MAQKLRKHGKKMEKTSVGCHIDFTILLSMLKVKISIHSLGNEYAEIQSNLKTFNYTSPRALVITFIEVISNLKTFEPPRRKTNNVVSEQVRHRPACTVTEAG